MSEQDLYRLLERAATDDNFREQLRRDPDAAVQEFELTDTERYALAANDEDALRRLVGSDVVAFAAGQAPFESPGQTSLCGLKVHPAGPEALKASTKIASCGWTFGLICC